MTAWSLTQVFWFGLKQLRAPQPQPIQRQPSSLGQRALAEALRHLGEKESPAGSNKNAFGKWFGVALEGRRFVAGQRTRGQVTYPGYEHLTFDVLVEQIEPEKSISFRWPLSSGPMSPSLRAQWVTHSAIWCWAP